MRTIEVDELEGHVREVLRQVQEDGEPIEVVQNGDVVARLTPIQKAKPASSQQSKAFLDELDLLAEEAGKYWPEGVSAVDAVRDVRRES